MYRCEDIVAVAKRENNGRRNYLVVNRKQGKHIPVSPGETLGMFRMLADILKEEYRDVPLLLVGFAETATAIGALAAVELNAYYIQTTRENISGVNFLSFSEAHSHATEQKLVKDDLNRVIGEVGRIVFVEDEVTTGNTILSAIAEIEASYCDIATDGFRKDGGRIAFSVASILNGMDREAKERYRDRGIPLHMLLKTDHASYSEIAERYAGDGVYETVERKADGGNRETAERKTDGGDREAAVQRKEMGVRVREIAPSGYLDARRLQRGGDYHASCLHMSEEVLRQTGADLSKRYLVLGTEEFMYPALILADMLEKKGCCVRFHATTRSPIAVSSEPEYPLHVRYELVSMYEEDRRTFVYDLGRYDEVIVVCDAGEVCEGGEGTLLGALARAGNRNITMVRWHG